VVAAASARSLRRDTLARSLGKPFGIRSAQIAAVRLLAKDRIIMRYVAHNGPPFNHSRRLTPTRCHEVMPWNGQPGWVMRIQAIPPACSDLGKPGYGAGKQDPSTPCAITTPRLRRPGVGFLRAVIALLPYGPRS
jgi:hypothetical protein